MIAYRVAESLLAAEISLSRLNGCLPKQKLNLLKSHPVGPGYGSYSQADGASSTALDFIAEELEALADVDDPSLLRM